jgi:hypothetical protein
MESKAHLTDEELAQAWFEPSRTVAVHLEDCALCRAELIRLREALHARDTCTEEFWQAQRGQIWRRIAAARTPARSGGLRWGLAFAVLIIIAATLSMSSGNRPPQQNSAVVQVDPDHELLIEVERIVQAEGPMALQPAGLMTETQFNQDSAVSEESTHAN